MEQIVIFKYLKYAFQEFTVIGYLGTKRSVEAATRVELSDT